MVKKDKCEICGSTEGLEVHHIKLFRDILVETLDELKLENKDINKYTELEKLLITNVILGKHLNLKYLTLCDKCHKKYHKDKWEEICNGEKHKEYLIKRRLKKDNELNIYNKNIIIPYLKGKVGLKLFKEDQDKLVEIMNVRDLRNRIQKTVNPLNNYLEANNIEYSIIYNRLDTTVEGKRTKYTYWIIKHIA